jgi:crotonobetainyl-CoA:carnitine CoA-transferase CaiB-like acyl-CoA transferase
MESLFQGLRVLDLSTVLAGPSVASFFAELGAEVIKIENPRTQGDVTRSWKLSSESSESPVSAYFSSVNIGKQYRWMDLTKPENRPELEELIRLSDVVIVNFKEGDDQKFNLSAEDIHALQPKAIYASIKGFRSDPKRIAYDVVLQAECGFMFMNGNSESGPLKMPVALIDVIAAHQLKEGILCALLQRAKTGKGATVRTTLEESALSALMNQASNYLMAGHVPQASGSLHPNIAPYGETFQCADGKQLVLAVGSESQFRNLCEALEVNHLCDDPRFDHNQQRVVHRKELAMELEASFRTKTRDSWTSLLTAAGVPVGAIRSMDEVMESATAKRMIREEVIEGHSARRISGVSFRLES